MKKSCTHPYFCRRSSLLPPLAPRSCRRSLFAPVAPCSYRRSLLPSTAIRSSLCRRSLFGSAAARSCRRRTSVPPYASCPQSCIDFLIPTPPPFPCFRIGSISPPVSNTHYWSKSFVGGILFPALSPAIIFGTALRFYFLHHW